MGTEEVELLKELLILEGIMNYSYSIEDLELDYDNVTSNIISSQQKALEDLVSTVDEVRTILCLFTRCTCCIIFSYKFSNTTFDSNTFVLP